MPILVINAPKYQAKTNSKRSFSATLKSGIGENYALNKKIRSSALKAKKVIVLDKSAKRKAIGTINKIVATGQNAGNGIPRYDIHMSKLKKCVYKPESLNRNGVAII